MPVVLIDPNCLVCVAETSPLPTQDARRTVRRGVPSLFSLAAVHMPRSRLCAFSARTGARAVRLPVRCCCMLAFNAPWA